MLQLYYGKIDAKGIKRGTSIAGLLESRDLSRSLQLDDGETLMDVFPELQELSYSANDDTGDAFTAFVRT